MILSRRHMLALPALALPVMGLPSMAHAADRGIGKDDAKVVAAEWFSLTCPHCAHFAINFLPKIRTDLIDTGRMKLVFRDFPLDRVALTAAQVARSLPAERYAPFIEALLASQDRWAFARGIDNTAEIGKMAALAGMSRSAFDAAVNNDDLRKQILAEQDEASKTYQVDSTPTFIINGPTAKNRRESGAQTPEQFAALVTQAGG